MIFNKYKKYQKRVCIYINNTINSQIKYWKGQKRDVRYGKGMQWSSRRRNRWGWGKREEICFWLNSPPNSGISIRYNF